MELCSPASVHVRPSGSSVLSFQAEIMAFGKSLLLGCTSGSQTLKTKQISLPCKGFVRLTHRLDRSFLSSRGFKLNVSAESGRQSWDFGRFLRTLYFFNGPPNPLKFVESMIEKLSSSTSTEAPAKMKSSGVILVTGGTGGVGRRIVNILKKKGIPFRVLVRNEERARGMLGQDADLVIGDVTKEDTLAPEYFKGVKKVINTVSVIVGPKEGDTPDRAKYSQGIRFFEPEIKGDSPEKVEFIGMQNLINAVKSNVGLYDGKLLFGLKGNLSGKLVWGALDDVVMGGVSESTFIVDPTGSEDGGPTGLFKGVVSTANSGGFTSIRTKNFSVPEDLSTYDGIELRAKGDGRRYKLIVRTSADWDTVGYTASFDTLNGQWQTGEDVIRESGIPYSIIRPCALTEEPAGADLIFDQGDNITGKISREEVARICIAALESPYACNKTFEVKSTIPYSEPFTVDPANPPPEKDYNEYFKTLRSGITGKESLEQNPVPF
ncbi:Uncharacterized protein AXF42_Ash003034 [Apostasia shenzhenica]|uniref:Uncharacterized protein n=1 Tax=Apostasia shenzhenica TaxID=1088818 RepID=A0A2I0A808_9ASPA|nr:Uncharacterized protein AXF42_Ash003034 [Apostasia shenzhenica]